MNRCQGIQPIILAAGNGKRMQMQGPKPLVHLAGKPLIRHIAEQIFSLGFSNLTVVISDPEESFHEALADFPVVWVKQSIPQGTGDALRCAFEAGVLEADQVLVLYGDTPLVGSNSLLRLLEQRRMGEITGLSTHLPDPFGYGRVVRNAQGQVLAVVEEHDASSAQKHIQEVNSGIFLAPIPWLRSCLPHLTQSERSKEYYLTEIFSRAVQEDIALNFIQLERSEELLGINTPEQLAEAERIYQRRTACQLAQTYGIRFQDLNRFDLRGSLVAGRDVSIDANVCLEGDVILEDGVKLGAGVIVRDSTIGEGSEILPYSVIIGSRIGRNVSIGPFAHIRPGTWLGDRVSVGNFVEIKASRLGEHTKARHLSYLGNSVIGNSVNVGAGVITCNYDGKKKHQTHIDQGVFIGSNTCLVAPVEIGAQSFIGAGTVVTKSVSSHQLVTSRVPQQNRPRS